MSGLSYTDLRRQHLIDMIDGLPPGMSVWVPPSYVAAAFGADILAEVSEPAVHELATQYSCNCEIRLGDVKFTKQAVAKTQPK